MFETKLIRSLKTLEPREYSSFQQFYHSEYFYPGERTAQLLDFVLKYRPDFNSKKLEKEWAYAKLTGTKNYDDVKMRLLLSDALKCVNQYITVSRMLDDSLSADMFLLEHYVKSENDEHTLRRLEDFGKKIESLPYHGQEYYYYSYRLELLRNRYHANRSLDYDLDKLFHSLDGFYFLNKLKLICARLSHNFIFKAEDSAALVREIESNLQQGQFSNNRTIEAYSYSVLLLSNSNPESSFNKLNDLTAGDPAELDPSDVTVFKKILENYCIRRINAGETYRNESLYRLMENRLSKAREISAAEVKTFVTLCLRMNKSEVCWKFLHEKKDRIMPVELRDDVFNYSLAVYWFYRKQYDEVLRLLQQVEYLNIFYKIGSKKLLIETYYEMEEWDALDSAMNAFRVYIHRNKEISHLHKENNSNFINLLYKLVHTQNDNKTRLKELQQQVKEEEQLSERQWLHEKMEQRLTGKKT